MSIKNKRPRTYEEREMFLRSRAQDFAAALKEATRNMTECDRETYTLVGLEFLFEEMVHLGLHLSAESLIKASFWPLAHKRGQNVEIKENATAPTADAAPMPDNVISRGKVLTTA